MGRVAEEEYRLGEIVNDYEDEYIGFEWLFAQTSGLKMIR